MTIYIDIILTLKDGSEKLIAAFQKIEVQALTNFSAIDKLNQADYAYKFVSKNFGSVFNKYKNRIQKFYCIESQY